MRRKQPWKGPATLWMPVDHEGTAGWAMLGKTRQAVIKKIEEKGFAWRILGSFGWKIVRVRLVEIAGAARSAKP